MEDTKIITMPVIALRGLTMLQPKEIDRGCGKGDGR